VPPHERSRLPLFRRGPLLRRRQPHRRPRACALHRGCHPKAFAGPYQPSPL